MTRSRDKLTLICSLNVLAVLLLWWVEAHAAERWWPAMVLTYMPQWLLAIPTVALLALALRRRKWLPTALTGVSGLLLLFGPLGLGVNIGKRDVSAEGRTFRVLTWNIQAEELGARGLLEYVRRVQPDVVCLQEAGYFWKEGGPSDELLKGLRGYHVVKRRQLLIASRFPVLGSNSHPLPHNPDCRPALEARLGVGNRTVTVINAHLIPLSMDRNLRRRYFFRAEDRRRSITERTAQVDVLLRISRQSHDPVILCGDFNMPPRGLLYQKLCGELQDTFRAAGTGFGYTIPAKAPMRRVDHVFIRGLHIGNAFVPRVIASDHRPLVVDVALPPPAPH